jgi:fructose-bisphosphate aldolase, class I
MDLNQLNGIAEAMVADHKGLLAADESHGTMAKRLASINVDATEQSRRDYRELLFRSEGLGQFISGIILYDETIRQRAQDNSLFTDLIKADGIIPGIKVDMGAKPLAGSEKETVTEGLDDLPGRIDEYCRLGAQFAKWRAVIRIDKNMPSQYCINVNAQSLARYARICQEGGLVPIVEPEVLMEGEHSIEQCQEVTELVLQVTFRELYNQGVKCEGMILKPNMVISGQRCSSQADMSEVAEKTILVLRRTVPASVPGIMFLSGGQSEELATSHLHLMNLNFPNEPWKLSFSYGRALQESALKAWRGQSGNINAAQRALLERARQNSLACKGESEVAANTSK